MRFNDSSIYFSKSFSFNIPLVSRWLPNSESCFCWSVSRSAPVRMRTGTWLSLGSERKISSRSKPFRPGMNKSKTIISGTELVSDSRASRPLSAVVTVKWPASSSIFCVRRRSAGSSSTIRMLCNSPSLSRRWTARMRSSWMKGLTR